MMVIPLTTRTRDPWLSVKFYGVLTYGEIDIAKQNKHQFIELYNTTNAAIDLTGWKLIFTEGRPVPDSDIDQVSNREGVTGWDVNIGSSGRVTNTTADGRWHLGTYQHRFHVS